MTDTLRSQEEAGVAETGRTETSEVPPSGLEQVLAHVQISDVIARYAQGVDRKDWDRVLSCYHEDAIDSHGVFVGSPTELVAWMKGNHEHVTSCMHVLSNIRIELSDDDPELARAESYCLSHKIISSADHDPFLKDAGKAGEIHRTIACRFIDTFERRPESGWRILRRTVVYEWARIDPTEVFVPMDPGLTYSRRDKLDLLYSPLRQN